MSAVMPFTPAQQSAQTDYREACERLANASVAMMRADNEHGAALAQYNEAHGAALQAGVIEK